MARACFRPLLALVFALPLAACSGDGTVIGCRVNADCVSGVCQPDFTCAAANGGDGGSGPVDAGDGDAGDGGSADGGLTDAGPADGGSGGGSDAGVSGCAPNFDGRIEASELTLRAGLSAQFRIATNASVNTAGTSSGGSVLWDFSGALPGDRTTRVELEPVIGQWFASSFPNATYAAQLGDGADLLGVFRVLPDELQLLGVVSRSQGVGATNLSYVTPITVLRLPIQQGATWQTSSTVTGIANGFAVALTTESYRSTVDRAGSVKTPFGTFPALRVNTTLERLVGVLPTRNRTFLFVSECFGTVASVRSVDGSLEPAQEFDTAAEIRRLTP